MAYCMYLRKSRMDLEAEARGEGDTFVRHEKILWELAKKLNLHVKKDDIFREGVSGETIASRPVMQQVLSDVEHGRWAGVLVVEVERLARGDTMDQGLVAQTFKYSNTKIYTPMKTYDPANQFDEEYFEFGLFMSRREYKTINRRLQQGRIQAVKEGSYLGNVPPYGYELSKVDGKHTLTPSPEQAKVVQLVYDLYTSGTGISLIVRKLNDIKVPTVKGGHWVVSTIRGILSNPVYTGKIRWNERKTVKKMIDGEIVKSRPRSKKGDCILVNGLHEKIITEEIFNLAQDILASNPSTPAPISRGVKNPLSGLIICGKCGRRMIRRPYSDGYPDTLMCPSTACDNVSSHLHLVEDRLTQALEVWLNKYLINIAKDTDHTKETEILEVAIKNLENEISTLNKQLSSLHDLLEQGVYTVEVFLERSHLLNDKISNACKDKDRLKNQMAELEIRGKIEIEIVPRVEKVLKLYNDLESAKDKNKMLKEILDQVVYTKEVSGRWHASPDDFDLVIYPSLPK